MTQKKLAFNQKCLHMLSLDIHFPVYKDLKTNIAKYSEHMAKNFDFFDYKI